MIISTEKQGVLPAEVREALKAAARTPKATNSSLEAVLAIDKVSAWAKEKYQAYYYTHHELEYMRRNRK